MISLTMDLEEKIMKFCCKEKLLPHYFGRLIHAFDIFGFGNNEGNGSLVKVLFIQESLIHSINLEQHDHA